MGWLSRARFFFFFRAEQEQPLGVLRKNLVNGSREREPSENANVRLFYTPYFTIEAIGDRSFLSCWARQGFFF